jgi:hypothetical protein
MISIGRAYENDFTPINEKDAQAFKFKDHLGGLWVFPCF